MTTQAPTADERAKNDPRPIVRTSDSGRASLWLFALALAIGGVLLFTALSARRAELQEAGPPVVTTGGQITSPPPLDLPTQPSGRSYPDHEPAQVLRRLPSPADANSALLPTRNVPNSATQSARSSDDNTIPLPRYVTPIPTDYTAPSFPKEMPSSEDSEKAPIDGERILARRLVRPAYTVEKGTIIPAVLETALDSTRPGGARAIVSRDVKSFDGGRVLIPRGSRLYGEYQADLQAGQKRALVLWTRLTRPDGVIIDLDSPAADPLGRAGIKGKVDTHFWRRFGDAILNTSLNVGGAIAARSVAGDGGVVVALPGSAQTLVGGERGDEIRPTLSVRQGTSVSVMVARDLDFSSVDL